MILFSKTVASTAEYMEKQIRQELIKHLLNWYSFLYVMFTKQIYS